MLLRPPHHSLTIPIALLLSIFIYIPFTQPKAILRYLEVFFALVTFAILADWGLHGPGAHALNAMMAFGILTFLWGILMVVAYLVQPVLAPFIKIFNLFELIIDAILVLWGVIVSIKVAADLGSPDFDNAFIRSLRAAIAFSFFTTFCLIVSVILDVMTCMKPQATQTSEAAA